MNSNHDSGTETGTEHSPSRFTAVNGRDAMVPPVNTIAPPTGGSNQNNGERGGQHDQWAPRSQGASNQSDEHSGERDEPANDPEATAPPRPSSQGVALLGNKHKRKRSGSRERRNSVQHPEGQTGPGSPVDRDGTEPHAPSQPNGAASSGPGPDTAPGHTSDAPRRRNGVVDASRPPAANGPWPEYEPQMIDQARRPQQIDTSDVQLADALQHEAQGPESPHGSIPPNHPPGQGSTTAAPSAPSAVYAPERPPAAVQVAPKRKRVFSNRTKTGCMTCRRRKKKCDEQHPSCNNCTRGGFLCEGYSSRSTWQKPSSSKAPVPLQSKEGYPEFAGQYITESGQHHDRQLTEHVEAGKLRPVGLDEPDRSAQQYNTSPTATASSASSWSKRGWHGTGHPAYVSEHLAKDYREVPPIHELPRDGHPASDYAVVPSIRELSHGPLPNSNMPLFQAGVEQRPLPSTVMDTNSPQAQARMALSIENQLSGRTVSNSETEKEKMLRGELYRPFDVQLVDERDRCKRALWRFNNACNSLSGVSASEQSRLLKEVLMPPSSSVVNSPSGVAAPRSAGSIGVGVVVEAPFHCHYGYNVHLAEDVMVSENCSFIDDCPIKIGAHTWIGPRVTILSSMAHANMQERKGTQSRYLGRQVTIEEDCYVSAGCILYPGVRVGRGAYVAPGEVVRADIPAYSFQGLKPSYM